MGKKMLKNPWTIIPKIPYTNQKHFLFPVISRVCATSRVPNDEINIDNSVIIALSPFYKLQRNSLTGTRPCVWFI